MFWELALRRWRQENPRTWSTWAAQRDSGSKNTNQSCVGCYDKYPDEGNLLERRLTKLNHVEVEGPSSQSSRHLMTLYSQSRSSYGMLTFHSISLFIQSRGHPAHDIRCGLHSGWNLPSQFTHIRKNPYSHAQRPFWSTQSLTETPFPGNSKSCHGNDQH